MASTYTQTGIELIGTGEQSGTWGTTTNTNLEIIDRLTNGVGAISLSGTTHTLTTSDGTLSDGQYAVLVFGGTPSGTNTVTISPNNAQHVYIVKNGSGESVVLTQGSGGNVTVADGDSAIVYADGAGAGAAVVDVTSTFNLGTVTSVGGTGTVNGITLTGTVTSSGNLTLGGTFSATISEISDITASAAEINILDGVTATTAEINYLDITTLGTSQSSKAVTADANGNIKLTEEVQAVCYLETVIGLSGTTPTVDCDEGNTFTLTTSGNTTFTFDYSGVNLTTDDAYAFTLRVTSGGTHTLTWPASVDWAGGTAPDAPASGETDVYVFFTTDGGTNWYGFLAGDAMS